jgi:MYXO-CTERM domain-containing protein
VASFVRSTGDVAEDRLNAKAFLVSGLFLAAGSLVARGADAQTFGYCDFSSVATLTLNGNAAQVGVLLDMTPNAVNQRGTAYRTTPIAWAATTSFETSFRFQLTPNGATGADGIAFILENTAVTALGNTGGALGYGLVTGGMGPGGGIAKSVEIEFDTFQNTWDTNANHVAVMSNGNNQTHLSTYTPPFTMAGSGIVYAWIDYNAPTTTLTVYVSQSFTKPAAPNITLTTLNLATTLGAQAFVGFTGGTGGDTNTQEILEWQFSTTGEPCVCGGDSACGGSTPICDASASTCRACTSNADCGGTTPVCAPAGNPKAGQCVACASNTDCDSNVNTKTPICSLTGATTDTCVACTTSTQCAATAGLEPLCDTSAPYSGQCVQCLSSADCTTVTDDPNCVSTGVTNVCGCLSNTDCPVVTPICNTTTHQCGGCTSDSQCFGTTPACQVSGPLMGECTQCSSTNMTDCKGATPACDDATGTCVGCTSNTDCSGTKPICNLTTNVCGPCASSTDCAGFPTTPLCATSGPESGACVACLSNTDCMGTTPVCNPANDTCVGCLTNADCSGATPICNTTAQTCGPCTSDADCSSPTPACQTSGALAGECTQCSNTNGTECAPGSATPVCVPSDGECGCTMTSDCASDQTCKPSASPAGQCVVNAPDGGSEAGMMEGGPGDAGSDAFADAHADGGHFGDGSTSEGGIADTGSIGGGGCACSTVENAEGGWIGGGLVTLLALAATKRRRRSEGRS